MKVENDTLLFLFLLELLVWKGWDGGVFFYSIINYPACPFFCNFCGM